MNIFTDLGFFNACGVLLLWGILIAIGWFLNDTYKTLREKTE